MKTAIKQNIEIGKKPVVILPLSEWENIKEYIEDLEMKASLILRKKIAAARKEKKLYSSSEARRMLGV